MTDQYYTLQDRVDHHTYWYGLEQQESQWILSPFDTWERNPHYTGEDQGHPEDQGYHCEEHEYVDEPVPPYLDGTVDECPF